MSRYPESMIPEPILANIKANQDDDNCGCEPWPFDPTRWNLCAYHDGMCDGYWTAEEVHGV